MFEGPWLVPLKLHDNCKFVRASGDSIGQARYSIVVGISNREDTLFKSEQAGNGITGDKVTIEVVVVCSPPYPKYHGIDVDVGTKIQLVEVPLRHEKERRGDRYRFRCIGRSDGDLHATGEGVAAGKDVVGTAVGVDEPLGRLGQVVHGSAQPSVLIVVNGTEVHVCIQTGGGRTGFIGCVDETFALVDLIGEAELGPLNAGLLNSTAQTETQVLLMAAASKLQCIRVIEGCGNLAQVSFACTVRVQGAAYTVVGSADGLVIRNGRLSERSGDGDPLCAVIHGDTGTQGRTGEGRIQ